MNAYTPLPAQGPRKPSLFERRSRQPGGSSRSYSEGVSAPAHKKAERQRTLLLLALVIALPPVGVVCLWRGGFFPVIYRALATLFAFLLLILYFYLLIPEQTPTVYQPGVNRPSAVEEYSPSSQAASSEEGALAGN